MTPLMFLLLSLAGGLGAAARLVLDGIIRSRVDTAYPVGTTLINVTGSLLLGFVTSLAAGQLLSEEIGLVLGAGLMGGFTTFSTASFETVRLIHDRRHGLALASSLGALVTCVLASALGLWLGSLP